MNESISIEHKIQYFSVTGEPEQHRSRSGKSVLVTKGMCTYGLPRACPVCGGPMHVHDRQHVMLQDYELFGQMSLLDVSFHRVACRFCAHTETQKVPFRSSGHMLTRRLEERVCRRLNQGSTIKAASISLGIHPSVVKDIDRRRLENMPFLTHPPMARYIGIDEFLLHRGHRYATVVTDLERRTVIFLEAGKRKEQAEHFIARMGPSWMKHVEAVSMDMNAQYDSAFRERAPDARIVYDRFHMVKLFNDSVITAIRRRLQGDCEQRHDRQGYELLKGSRYLVLTSRQNLHSRELDAVENNRRLHDDYAAKGLSIPPGERLMRTGRERRLGDLLAANSDLNVAYTMLDQFKYAYDATSSDVMSRGLADWYRLARQSKVPEILRFADTIRSHEDGLVNRVMHKISSGVVEGINNMIKTLRRKSYGFRDTEYFFLKIMFESYKPRSGYVSHKILS
jgi:transposase